MTYRCSLWGGPLASLQLKFWSAWERSRQRIPLAAPALRKVAPGLWAGGQLSKKRLSRLPQRGIVRVIDLRESRTLVRQEAEYCQLLGIEHLSFPIGEALPDFSQLTRLLACLDEAAHCPTYIHCREGKDRVGCIVALYRVTRQNWSLERAGAELLRNGFDTRLRYLAEDTAFYAATLRRPELRQKVSPESRPVLLSHHRHNVA